MTTVDELVRDLVLAAPTLEKAAQKNAADYGELLPHLFLEDDVLPYLEVNGADPAVLAVLDRHMRSGNEAVQNAIAVSFVESLVLGQRRNKNAILDALGPNLRAEL